MNVYDRLSNLFAYMCNQNFPATVHNIAKAMNIYEEQIAHDIAFIEGFEMPKGNPLFKPHMSITYIDGAPCYHMNPNAFVFYKDLELNEQYSSSQTSENYILCPMTYLEDEFIKCILEDKDAHDSTDSSEYNNFSLRVIPKLLNSQENIPDIMPTIEKAISLGAKIKFNYQDTPDLYLIPHLIMRDINTRKLYVIETYAEDNYLDVFSINEMSYVRIISTQNTNISPEKLARAQCFWSFKPEYLDKIMDQAPTHIKIKIFEDNADIINKIKADTSCRSKGILSGPFQSQDDSSINIYYYEDDIIGLEAFKEWIRQFGSSMVVLEPKNLAYDIYKELVIEVSKD